MEQANAALDRPRRESVFHEVGLLDDKPPIPPPDYYNLTRANSPKVNPRSPTPPIERIDEEDEIEGTGQGRSGWDQEKDAPHPPHTRLKSSTSSIFRVILLALVIISIIHLNPFPNPAKFHRNVASTSDCEENPQLKRRGLERRANSPTDVCKRWSQQSAIVNGTLYLYGGRATMSSSQTSDTWNNDFVTIDLTKSWKISAPAFAGLPQPAGPPAVANGYLWSSYDSLFLYGGEFSDSPQATPTDFSLWEYKIPSSSWIEHKNPQTSAGNNSEPAGVPIQRAAEGAGYSIKSLGLGYYFGGHLDFLTSPSWSIQTPREYLKSFMEFTFPGDTNTGVTSLLNNGTAGSDGAWRNITQAGIQDQAGFTERADGLVVYVPGWGQNGILLSLGGGTNQSFSQMNVIDVYDVANSTWYRASTTGTAPQPRVNPCAVVAAAADGTSYSVYMFGGQNLLPTGEQIQYNDMWILSVPSLIWVQVNTTSQATPYPRAGHTCNIWDSQMIVVGGYVGDEISCESPGVYVFNTSSLQWVNGYTSLSNGSPKNPWSQQEAQVGTFGKNSGIEGSYDYSVPEVIYTSIGGGPTGGATIAGPIITASAGPMATGKPVLWTVTSSGTSATSTPGPAAVPSKSSGGTNVGAAVAGAVAGLLFCLALYLAFCAFLYRKQLGLYKRHGGRQQEEGSTTPFSEPARGFFGGVSKHGSWKEKRQSTEGTSSSGVHSPPMRQSAANGTVRPYSSGSGGSLSNSHEDLMDGMEPNYWGVLLHPRTTLRVINR